ncbi:hypothetical protein P152DRAFT_446725 [Eremomyces bilateralis CBS 781.70]|uniref:Uncharacterized protein n=1 Tax=Eremomyces bilateralis CBS 781.70 TaxID=1392243 RepID=A0A6G1GC63_9PEZI|nr:uncharacterized protein P152DRAFT_446725 [Eremomyces bilateralis CBS 781.70]KAF1815685.1 hypothetical protein P152DRAFT_446725 [Eremomyces bilateralis CBS 781.70]
MLALTFWLISHPALAFVFALMKEPHGRVYRALNAAMLFTRIALIIFVSYIIAGIARGLMALFRSRDEESKEAEESWGKAGYDYQRLPHCRFHDTLRGARVEMEQCDWCIRDKDNRAVDPIYYWGASGGQCSLEAKKEICSGWIMVVSRRLY